MTDNRPFDAPWEDDSEEGCVGDESALDAFDAYLPPRQADDDIDDPWDAASSYGRDEQELTFLFTATNPAGTVSATAMMDGTVVRVELSPQVTEMTEAELGKEITAISILARQQAQAGLHAVIAHFGRQLGRDEVSMRSFLEHELHLPSPDTVYAEQARLFAAHYDADHGHRAN
ncbi:hypothetical protein MFM001_05320 [Mycobacterium sp. MFM001]|uniref:hypothetical protein n=1 Tax=Mycobacterium sp. MFM001 TaxID=2049453 RepID=UPI000DA4767C|nr:hypothetical protein [Mycobacterium sp. MFM001]GBE64070.1 hypothetical protein MFM001_05320 [Mycobacterium sp. MFM001]